MRTQTPNLFIKIGTVSLFVLLLSFFVAFKAGWLGILTGKEKQLAIAEASLNRTVDTSGRAAGRAQDMKDSLDKNQLLLSSSKSTAVLPGDFVPPGWDFIGKQLTKSNGEDSFMIEPDQILSSSKSFIISGVVPVHTSIAIDTSAKVKIDSFYLDEEEMMGSSKSGRIWTPKPDTSKKKKK